ncbi:MAG: penicillin-binding protein 1C [Deltaproteobacteria bacterium]|nr:penicillin-binding protein 1C [Deltaproteobacteria bacterium]
MSRRTRWVRRGGVALLGMALLLVGLRVAPHAPLQGRASYSRAVYARGGELLRLTLADDEQYRFWTPLPDISPFSVEAALLYEDRWFRAHPGVNPYSLARAVGSLLAGGRRLGGSTVTMQLARRLFAIDSRHALGKLHQILAALWLEARHGKDEILEAYLNLAPYGGNVEGIGAASLVHFGKPPARLSLPEALSLALLPQNPNQRVQALRVQAPEFARMREALGRRLLARRPAAGDARLATLAATTSQDALPFLAPHFTDQMLARPATENADRTTLDLPLQRLLERQVARFVEGHERLGVHNAAALLVDARDMGVRALVGSADFFDDAISGQVDGTRARRSPGSVLKPFVYALGMEQGVIHPRSVLRDAPVSFSAYSPENFDGRYAGPLPAADALVRSRNVPALLVAAKLDRPTFHQFLTGAGVGLSEPESHYGLGLVLGTGEVTMEEVSTLFAALANRGLLRPLRRRMGDATPPPVRVLSEEASWLVLDMLAKNPRPFAPRLVAASAQMPVPWKTGTSWGFRDAWSAGLVGPYVLVVWVGDFDGRGNPEFVGVKTAAPLFFSVVDALAAHERALATPLWPRPTGLLRVDVCVESGQIPNPHCPHTKPAWFIAGRSPTTPCEIHRAFAIDDRTGRRVCDARPHGPTHQEVFAVWPTDMLKLFAAAGLPRQAPPSAMPGCPAEQDVPGAPPRITSPLGGVAYTLRPGKSNDTLAFLAETDGDAHEVFWYVGRRFAGKTASGRPWLWKMRPGTFVVRAVDDRGRADAQTLRVEVSQ